MLVPRPVERPPIGAALGHVAPPLPCSSC